MKDIGYREAMYDNWKEEVLEFGISGINKTHSDFIIKYIVDMEEGKNCGKVKRGKRSYSRLLNSKHILIQIAKILESRGFNNFTKITSDNITDLINDMHSGKIEKQKGGKYSKITISDYVKIFKAFFNWFRRVEKRENGKRIEDITEDLSGNYTKTRFVYITKKQKNEIKKYLTLEQQLFGDFLWDSLIRTPLEVFNLKVKDIYRQDSEVWTNVPEEISKTFGRVFNLLYCGEEIMKHIEENKLGQDDYLFSLNYKEFNRRIKEVAVKLYGDIVSHPKAEKKYSELSGYDYRHCGAIDLRQVAQKNNAISLDSIRQRAGWANFDMLNYYTQFLGLTGEIKKESLLIQEDRSKLEKDIETQNKKLKIVTETLMNILKEKTSDSKNIMTPEGEKISSNHLLEELEKHLKH